MATYAIGDVQGCFTELQDLLCLIEFNASRDRLWFTGDLVNRGRESLETLRLVSSLGDAAITVLGNHDLHLLAVYYADQPENDSDTFDALLAAPDCDRLLDWLRHRPLLHRAGKDALVHAGIPHIWNIEQASSLAEEVEACLRGPYFRNLLRVLYGDCPRVWHNNWKGVPRLRAIVNYLVRMRVINPAGRCDFDFKGDDRNESSEFKPWFDYWPGSPTRLLFGHWAALGAETGRQDIVALDAGCAWGYKLMAMRLEDSRRFSVPFRSHNCSEEEAA